MKNAILPILTLALLLATTVPPTGASHDREAIPYQAAGTVVVDGDTVSESSALTNDAIAAVGDATGLNGTGGNRTGGFDEGVLRCDATTGAGQGGFCVHDNRTQAVEVLDGVLGYDVAFQVCRDANRNGICSDRETIFSHGNNGAFANPVDVPGWPGSGQIVVFLCTGVHASGDAHQHQATVGHGFPVPDPNTGVLDGFTAADGFCGGSEVGKRYVIQ